MSDEIIVGNCRCYCHEGPYITHIAPCCAKCPFCGRRFRRMTGHLEECPEMERRFKRLAEGENGDGG